jgi:hypothetical protein
MLWVGMRVMDLLHRVDAAPSGGRTSQARTAREARK